MSVCKTAEKQGIFVLHGNRGSFHTEKQPAFKAIYSSIEQVRGLKSSLFTFCTKSEMFPLIVVFIWRGFGVTAIGQNESQSY